MNIRVLLADDHEIVRIGLAHVINAERGMTVVAQCRTGEDAYREYATIGPDVVVMDIAMPGMGGVASARRIRQYDNEARIIMLSSHEDPPTIRRSLEIGVLGYLGKSGASRHLVDAIRQVSQSRHYLDPELRTQPGSTLNDPASELFSTLSNREFEVFRLLALGHSVVEISEMLSVSPKTTGSHYTSIMHKLGLSNIAQLAHLALEYGVVNLSDPRSV